MINSDRLAAWWEKEAQEHLANHPLGNYQFQGPPGPRARVWGDAIIYVTCIYVATFTNAVPRQECH